MRISSSIMLSAVAALAVAAPSIAGSPHPAPGSQSDSVTHICNEESGDTIALNGPTLLWPPNHKMVPIEITMTDVDQDAAPVEFGTTSRHNEVAEDGTEMNGSGNTATDSADIDAATGEDVAVGTLEIRSERSGRGDGRVYTVDVAGMAGDDECSTTFTILVPHDMRPDNRVKPDNEQG